LPITRIPNPSTLNFFQVLPITRIPNPSTLNFFQDKASDNDVDANPTCSFTLLFQDKASDNDGDANPNIVLFSHCCFRTRHYTRMSARSGTLS
jgi:hypothetical protein